MGGRLSLVDMLWIQGRVLILLAKISIGRGAMARDTPRGRRSVGAFPGVERLGEWRQYSVVEAGLDTRSGGRSLIAGSLL